MAGDALWAPRRAKFWEVSIHTRHEWRVMRELALPGDLLELFQSTPAMNGG